MAGTGNKNIVLSVIQNRKSVRNFIEKPVTKGQIEILLKTGMAAPSAANRQPWAFIAVTERKKLNVLADNLPHAKMLYTAAAAVIVCGIPEKGFPELKDYWVQDCAAATQNILLAAESIGLGAVWTGVYPRPERVQPVKSILKIPDNVIPLNVLAIGYPVGNESSKDKFRQENIHWEHWHTEKKPGN